MWIEIPILGVNLEQFRVTSLAEVWIEIFADYAYNKSFLVTSLAEVWIEIVIIVSLQCESMSLPLRKCGLK